MRTPAAAWSIALTVLGAACSGNGTTGADPDGRSAREQPAPASAEAFTVCYDADPSSGGGTAISLSDVTTDVGLDDPLKGMHAHATAVGDVNADGWTDLFVGTFADRPVEEYRVRGAEDVAPDRLLLGGPDGFRIDESFPEVFGRTSGAAFADLDRDGDLDLVIARNQREGERAGAPSVVNRNDGGVFVEATALDRPVRARSIGVLDYDGDGLLDLFLVEDRFGEAASSVLMRNEGELQFADATAEAGLPSDVDGLGVATADLTGDAHPDLFVSGSNRLFVNAGSGTFQEARSPLPQWERFGDEDDVGGVAVGDVNADGRTDLVVGQHYNSTIDDGQRVPVRLYLNEGVDDSGAPRLRDVTDAAGLVALPTKAPHVELADLDADGGPDIVTSASSEDGSAPAVFRHHGVEGGVPSYEAPSGVGSAQYWPTGAVFDADRDGRLDVFMAEWEPALASRLFANGTDAGRWLGVQVGPSGTDGVGATVEVFRAGAAGDPAQVLGRREITVSTGFGAGALPVAYFGLADAETVDVVVGRGTEAEVELAHVPTDRLVQVRSNTPCGQ